MYLVVYKLVYVRVNSLKRKNHIIIAYLLSLVLLMTGLTGCGIVPAVDLNDEQMELVSEYAAGLLLRYVKGHKNGLMHVSGLDFNELNITPTPTPTPTVAPIAPVPVIEEGNVENVSDEKGKKDNIEISLVPINEAFSLNGADLNFSYGELTDTYPSGEDTLAFAMNATPGKDLLILHFDLSNFSGTDLELTSNLNGYKSRVIINEDEKIRGEITFLPNDLMNYSGQLLSGETQDVVLVFEVEEGTQIESLNLLLVNGSDQRYYKLV